MMIFSVAPAIAPIIGGVLWQWFGWRAITWFLVLFSSISAVLVIEGQVDYVAANAFLDAFAHEQASAETRVVSANWGAWREVGLAVKASNIRHSAQHVRWQPGPSALLERQRPGLSGSQIFETSFHPDRHWIVGEHRTRNRETLLPGTAYLAMADAALAAVEPGAAVEISQVFFNTPFAVPATDARDLDLTMQPTAAGYDWFARSSAVTHALGKARKIDLQTDMLVDSDVIVRRCPRHRHNPDGMLEQSFMSFGPRWACLHDQYFGDDEAILSLSLPSAFMGDIASFRLHPALLDMATGGAQELIPEFDAARDFYVPFSYGRVLLLGQLPGRFWSHVRLGPGTRDGLAMFDVTILDEHGRVVIDINDFCMKRVDGARLVATGREGANASVDASIDASVSLAENMLRLGMKPAEGLDALEWILASPATPQIVVSTVDVAAWQALHDRANVTDGQDVGLASSASAPSNSDALGQGGIEDRLTALWREILGVQQVGMHDNFFDLGGHSLLAVRLLTRVEKQFHRTLSVAELFSAPTIAGIASVIRASPSGADSREPDLVPIARDTLRASRRQLAH
jgi:acyl carrier protein